MIPPLPQSQIYHNCLLNTCTAKGHQQVRQLKKQTFQLCAHLFCALTEQMIGYLEQCEDLEHTFQLLAQVVVDQFNCLVRTTAQSHAVPHHAIRLQKEKRTMQTIKKQKLLAGFSKKFQAQKHQFTRTLYKRNTSLSISITGLRVIFLQRVQVWQRFQELPAAFLQKPDHFAHHWRIFCSCLLRCGD